MKRRRRSRYWLYSSMSLCPAPSTHSGSTALGQRSYRARPWEKSITSSSVPWMINTGDVILDTFSMLKQGHTNEHSVLEETRLPQYTEKKNYFINRLKSSFYTWHIWSMKHHKLISAPTNFSVVWCRFPVMGFSNLLVVFYFFIFQDVTQIVMFTFYAKYFTFTV